MGFSFGGLGDMLSGGLSTVAGNVGNLFNPTSFLSPTSFLNMGGGGSGDSGVDSGGGGGGSFMDMIPGIGGGGGGGPPMDLLKKLGLGSPGANSLLDLGSGLIGLNRANKTRQVGQDAGRSMDPFGAERPMYAQKLRELYANPSAVQNLPGYKAGMEGIQRSMAANGYLSSGNMMTAMADYGGKAFNDEASRLALLSGAGMPPQGGNLMLSGQNASNDLMGKSMGTLGFAGGNKGIWDLLKNASGSLMNMFSGGGAEGTVIGGDAMGLLGEEGIAGMLAEFGGEAGGAALLAI